ncbi:hypothetical protein MRX96_054580 [Rhipicephalus microplus]
MKLLDAGLVARCFSYEKVRAANARRVAAESRRPTSVKERDGRLSPNSVHRPRRGLPAHRGQLRLKGDVAAAPTNWTGHDVDCFGDLCRRCRRPNAAKSSHLLYFPPAFHVLATTEARNCYVTIASAAPLNGMPDLSRRALLDCASKKGVSRPLPVCPPSPRFFHFVLARGWVSWRAGVLRSVTGFQAASLASALAAAVDRRPPTTLRAREPVTPAIGRGVHLSESELVMVT